MTMFGQLEVTLWVDWIYNYNSNFKECINYDNVFSLRWPLGFEFTIPIPILKSVLIMTMFGQLEVTLWVWIYNYNSNFKECIN